MAYVERDDRDMDFNEQSDIFDDDSVYDDMYAAENFGERVDSGDDEQVEELDSEEVVVTDSDDPAQDEFGETIDHEFDDNVQSQETSSEDQASSDKAKKDGLFTKAKEKLDEWTDKDKRE